MGADGLSTEVLAGAAVAPVIADLARLRVAVFREFPYLYDGDLDYERSYLRKYAGLEESTIVVARDADPGTRGRVIGASTALPLARCEPELQAPFRATGIPVGQVYYFGESVLEPGYRGRGLGHAFFDGRERRARALGYTLAAFCAVARPADHPRRPPDYRPLDGFWTKRRYVQRPDLRAAFTWRDLDETAPSPKPMVFWLRQL